MRAIDVLSKIFPNTGGMVDMDKMKSTIEEIGDIRMKEKKDVLALYQKHGSGTATDYDSMFLELQKKSDDYSLDLNNFEMYNKHYESNSLDTLKEIVAKKLEIKE